MDLEFLFADQHLIVALTKANLYRTERRCNEVRLLSEERWKLMDKIELNWREGNNHKRGRQSSRKGEVLEGGGRARLRLNLILILKNELLDTPIRASSRPYCFQTFWVSALIGARDIENQDLGSERRLSPYRQIWCPLVDPVILFLQS